MKRRDFIKTSAAAAGFAGLLPPLRASEGNSSKKSGCKFAQSTDFGTVFVRDDTNIQENSFQSMVRSNLNTDAAEVEILLGHQASV